MAGNGDTILRVEHLTMRFGGLVAVDLDVYRRMRHVGADDAVGGDARELAVFGVGAKRHDLHFLDPVVVEERPGGAAVGVADVDAVHQEGVRALCAAERDV